MNFIRMREVVLNGLVVLGLVAFIYFLARYIILPGEASWGDIPLDIRVYAFLGATGFVVTAMSVLGLVLAIDAWVRSRRLCDPSSAKRAGWSILAFAVGAFLFWLLWNATAPESDKHPQPSQSTRSGEVLFSQPLTQRGLWTAESTSFS
jgi:hypothetical protein